MYTHLSKEVSPFNQKRAGKRKLLEGCFCCAESARPLIGCLDMDIVCRRSCSDKSETRIPVTERYRILTGGGHGGVAQCLACIHQSDAQFMRHGMNIPPDNLLACSLWRKFFFPF